MTELSVIGNTPTMTSREIAELTGSTHDNVLKTVRGLADKGIVSKNETPYTHPQNGQTYAEFNLSYRDTMVVVSGYSPELRAKIIDRWQELEAVTKSNALVIPDFSNPALAARAWADQFEARLLAESTKAEIGSRREATAMNTASQAVKKANNLEIQLDQSKRYASVKRMEMLYHGQKFNWRLLKIAAVEMGMPPIPVFDANYGKVNAYHADVWREAFAVGIEAIVETA